MHCKQKERVSISKSEFLDQYNEVEGKMSEPDPSLSDSRKFSKKAELKASLISTVYKWELDSTRSKWEEVSHMNVELKAYLVTMGSSCLRG